MNPTIWNRNTRNCSLFSIGMILMAIAGCGGGGGGGSLEANSVIQGVFVDNLVQGVKYQTATQNGITGHDGKFSYLPGQTVTFYIGDVAMGHARGKAVVTPIDLVEGAADQTNPTVTNIIRLLQSLDFDGNPDNGILITETIFNELQERTINFNQSAADFASDPAIANILYTLNSLAAFSDGVPRNLCTVENAQTHFYYSLIQYNVIEEPVILTGGTLTEGTYAQGATWYTFNEDRSLDFSSALFHFGSWENGENAFTMNRREEFDTFFDGRIVPIISITSETFNVAFTHDSGQSLYLGAYQKISGDDSIIPGIYKYFHETVVSRHDGTSGNTTEHRETITMRLTYCADYTWTHTQTLSRTASVDEVATANGTWQEDGSIRLIEIAGSIFLINSDTVPLIRQ